jgi:hypothetical protein
MENNELKIQITYNWQVNNDNLNGKFKGTAQCGPTSCCMTLSAFIPDASKDEFVKKFIEMIDKDWLSGKIKTRQSAFQFNYEKTINEILKQNSINKKAIVKPHSGTINDVVHALTKGSPVMTSTMLTKDGHYICIVGVNQKDGYFIVHDPYGRFDFQKNTYIEVKDNVGAFIKYPINLLSLAMEKSSNTVGKKGYRIIWIE